MTPQFEEWAREMKYKLNKEPHKPEVFKNAWIYSNTHTQSAWDAWDAALALYGIEEEPLKFKGEEA